MRGPEWPRSFVDVDAVPLIRERSTLVPLAGTVTISGLGAYLGLAKVHNGGEDGAPVDDMITYNYSLSADGNSMDITIQGFNAGVPEATWIFKMVKAGTRSISFNTDPFIEQLRNTTTDAGVYDWSGYDSISFSYNNTVSQSLEDSCLLYTSPSPRD